jgi:hypothetical protein
MTHSSGGMIGFSVPVYEGHERGAFTNEHSSTKMAYKSLLMWYFRIGSQLGLMNFYVAQFKSSWKSLLQKRQYSKCSTLQHPKL